LAHETHHVRRGYNSIEIRPAAFDAVDDIFTTDDVCTGLFRFADLVALRDHQDRFRFSETVRQHDRGKSKTVLVIAQGDKVREAEEAGADIVGGEDVVNRIKGGWTDFDAVIATPDMMRLVGQLGKVLGPRGLMPNPKTGTVTPDVATAIRETKAGKVEYRVDKTGVIHVGVGKVSFDAEKLRDNTKALLDAVVKAKPATAKGKYVKKVNLAATMSPGVLLDETAYAK